eukprot:15136_1
MFVVGNYMVLSLFLAILLGNFEDDDDANDAKKPSAAKEMPKSKKHVREFGAKLKRMLSKKFHTDGAVSPMPSPRHNEEENKPMLVDRPLTHGNISVMRVEKDIDVEVLEKDKIDHTGIQRVALQHRSFFILGADNKFRVAVVQLLSNDWFERFVLLLIFLSAVFLALDEPRIDKNGFLFTFLFYADWVVTFLFTIEMILKQIAMGVFMHRGSYFRNGWNMLDGFIVAVSLLNLFFGNLKFFKGLRALRALRPLRMISRFPEMKIVVNSVFATVPALANVAILAILFLFVFSIVAVQQFSGRLLRCEDSSGAVLYVD